MRQAIPILLLLIAVVAMAAILVKGPEIPEEWKIPFAVLCIIGIAASSIVGLFEKSILKYVLFSTAIQFFYFLLDLSTAFLINKSVWFAVIQFINFTLAGGLFALVMALLYNAVRKEKVPDYAGLYDKNQFLVLALAASCLSLGGMPGFNIFVGEYIIYASLFSIHPALTVSAIFAGLVCFIFYFRICYVMFAGKSGKEIGLGLLSRIIIAVFTMLIVLLGVIPHILFRILELFT